MYMHIQGLAQSSEVLRKNTRLREQEKDAVSKVIKAMSLTKISIMGVCCETHISTNVLQRLNMHAKMSTSGHLSKVARHSVLSSSTYEEGENSDR